MNLSEQIIEFSKYLVTLKAFQLIHGEKIPDGLGLYVISSYGSPMFVVHLGGRTDTDREKALSCIGEIFGTDDWESEYVGYSNSFTWTRNIDGVDIRIEGAKVIPRPEKSKVHPNEFPVLLRNAEN